MQNRTRMLTILGAAVVLFVFFAAQHVQTGTHPDAFAYIEEEQLTQQENPMPEPAYTVEIMVHVAGAVQKPGVYTLEQGQRVEDALQLAGITEDADIDALNRAAVLTDGQKIVVPSKTEVQSQQTQAADDGMVNLNQADLTQLMTLPGIGEVKAQAVIRYRQEHNGFQTIEELLQVNGIGTATYGQIADLVCI